jgi:hypothetical protein
LLFNFGLEYTNGKCKLEYNIKMDVWEIGLEGVDWIALAQDKGWWQALVNMVMKL